MMTQWIKLSDDEELDRENWAMGDYENEEGIIEHYNFVMYEEQCLEEGVIPLGSPKQIA